MIIKDNNIFGLTPLKKYLFTWLECSVWLGALVWFAVMDPAAESTFSFCLFKTLGFTFCPGCGIGHSISWLLHGDLQQSLLAHPLGLFAIVILLHRIYVLAKKNLVTQKT